MDYTVWLPLPPSVNNAFPTSKSGRRFKSPEYKAWLVEAGKYKPPPIVLPAGTRWKLAQHYHIKTWRSDMDNRYKIVIDWLCKQYGLNDRYLVEHHATRFTPPKWLEGVACHITLL